MPGVKYKCWKIFKIWVHFSACLISNVKIKPINDISCKTTIGIILIIASIFQFLVFDPTPLPGTVGFMLLVMQPFVYRSMYNVQYTKLPQYYSYYYKYEKGFPQNSSARESLTKDETSETTVQNLWFPYSSLCLIIKIKIIKKNYFQGIKLNHQIISFKDFRSSLQSHPLLETLYANYS